MNPFKTQQEINAYLNQQLEDCKKRLAALEEDNKNRPKWFEPIQLPQPSVRKWTCECCTHMCDEEVWDSGYIFCSQLCRTSWIKRF